MIWRLLKLIFYLCVIGGIGLVAYAYLGPIFVPDDFRPQLEEVRQPVELKLE